MYKLTQHSLTRGVWFEPETQSMTLAERNTVSSITLGPDAPESGFNDWILDDEWPDGPTVWRVKSIDDQTDSKTVTVSLEHVIRLLEDIKLFKAVETSDISGGSTCTARQAIEYLLAKQDDWVLGDLTGGDVSLPYEFSGGDSLFDAIESVSDTLEDAEWWYDLSQYPFVLHIRKRNSSVMSEMRGERNLSTLRRNISRSGMYTRIWPVGYNDLHISGEYLSKNESLYGRVDKVETNQGKTSEDGLRAWAMTMLRKHCEPNVTITISGLELSQETGEPLDWIQLNRVCRCPLPEFHTTILERVIKIAWRDRRKDPESITVTLGNNAADVQDLTKTVSETSKSSGSAARGQAKQNYLFEANGEHLLYEVFDECGHLHGVLRMTEQSLRVAFENLNECTRSEFYMTSESLRVQFENEINSTRSQLEMTSESLRVQFENEINSTRSDFEMTSESLRVTFENEINSTRSQIEMTSESLRVQFENEINSTRSQLEITSESLQSTIEDTKEGLESQIEQTAEAVRLKVSKGDVGTQLAVELGNVSITGGNLVVDGYVTAAGLEASIAELSVVRVKSIQAEGTAANLSLPTVTAQSSLYVGTGAESVELIGAGIKDAVTNLQLTHAAGSATYTLQKKTISNSKWTDVGSFSKAATLSVEYGGSTDGDTATYTVTGSPSENFPSGNTAVGSFIVKQNKNWAYINDGNGTVRARIANPQYGNGWAAAYAEVDLPTTQSSNEYFTVKTPKSTTDGGADETKYTVSSATNDIAVVKNPAGTVVARLEHRKYTAGYTVGNAHRASSYDFSQAGDSDTAQLELNYNTKYKFQSKYQLADGSWENGSAYVVLTKTDRYDTGYNDGYNNGGATGWMDYRFKAIEAGVDTSGWSNESRTGHMGYGQEMCIRYRKADGTYGYVPAYWKTPPDNYQTGWNEGHAQGVIDGGTISTDDIQITTDSTGYTGKPSNATEIWSSRPGFESQKWYKFKVTVKGVTKWYAFYAKRA